MERLGGKTSGTTPDSHICDPQHRVGCRSIRTRRPEAEGGGTPFTLGFIRPMNKNLRDMATEGEDDSWRRME